MSIAAIMFNLYRKTHHSTKILFWNDWTFPEGLVPTNACTLDDYISVREGLLDHHNSRENQGREWQWTERTDAVIFWLLFSGPFNEGIPLNFTKEISLTFQLLNLTHQIPQNQAAGLYYLQNEISRRWCQICRGDLTIKAQGRGRECKDITDDPRCLWNFTMNTTLVLPCCNVQAVLSEL